MKSLPPLFRWLVIAAVADWLVARTLTRAAIFMPKSPFFVSAFQALGWAGIYAATMVGLLAVLAAGWIAWREARSRRSWATASAWAALAALSLAGVVIPIWGGLLLAHHALFLATMAAILLRATASGNLGLAGTAAVPAIGLAAGAVYQAIPALFEINDLAGPAAIGWLFGAGEGAVLLAAIGLWWVYGRRARLSELILAAFPALAFAVALMAAPSMTGVMAIWSTGLSLLFPWPIYVLGLWLVLTTILADRRRGGTVAAAILLLASGGYAPQFTSLSLIGLVAIWILADVPGWAAGSATNRKAHGGNLYPGGSPQHSRHGWLRPDAEMSSPQLTAKAERGGGPIASASSGGSE